MSDPSATTWLSRALLISCAVIRIDGALAQDVNVRDLPIFVAEEAAFRDFSGKLRLGGHPEGGLDRFLSDIRNYDMSAHEDSRCFVISFAPARHEGQALRGGGARYKIDKHDFHVMEVTRFK